MKPKEIHTSVERSRRTEMEDLGSSCRHSRVSKSSEFCLFVMLTENLEMLTIAQNKFPGF